MTKYRIIAYYHDCDVIDQDWDEPWTFDTEEGAQVALADFIEGERATYDWQNSKEDSVDNQLVAYIEPYFEEEQARGETNG